MSAQTDITGFFHSKKSKLSSSKQITKAINADPSILEAKITQLSSTEPKGTQKKVPLCERKRAHSPVAPSQSKRLKSMKKVAAPDPKVNTIYKAFEKKQLKLKNESVSNENGETNLLSTPDAPVKVSDTIQRKGKSCEKSPIRKKDESKSSAKKRLDMSPSFHLNQKLQFSPTRGALMLQRAAEKMGGSPAKDNSAVRKLFSSSSEMQKPTSLAEKLQKCGKHKEMLASVRKASGSLQQLKKFSENADKPQLSKFNALSFEVESPKKVAPSSPFKSPRKVAGTLGLPFKYRFLQELFYGLDTVVSMLHNRKETITWEKVKPAVQEMTRRNFLEKHLGQIWNVYPNGYKIQQEKTVARQFQKNNAKYNLTIQPILVSKGGSVSTEAEKYIQMDPKMLLQRRNVFHRNLIQEVKKHHREFLARLDPPVVIDDEQLTHWHSDFDLDKVEEIKVKLLPTPPTEETFNTAKDVLAKVCISHPLMEEALKKRSEENEKKDRIEEEPLTEEKAKVPDALKGVSLSLLAKIRQKEAARVQREMTRGPKENKRREQLSRLPRLSRILRGIYVADKKPAILWGTLVDRLTHSHPTLMSNTETEEHLNMLIEVVPGWLTVHNISSGRYLKINKNVDVNSVVNKLEKMLKA